MAIPSRATMRQKNLYNVADVSTSSKFRGKRVADCVMCRSSSIGKTRVPTSAAKSTD